MINYDDITRENIMEHNPNCPQIPHHSYKILINGGTGSGKTHALLNLISHQTDIDHVYLNGKYTDEVIHELLINKRKCVELKKHKDSKAFINY